MMRSIGVAFALIAASVAHPTVAGGDSSVRPAAVFAVGDEADGGKIPHAHRGKEFARDDQGKDRDGDRHDGKGGKSDTLELAAQLSALETRIGIRAGQLDAWRDYTTSLQSLLTPTPKSLDDQGDTQSNPHGPKDPFDREQKLADAQIEKAVVAERLRSAIAALRTVLTQQQLEQLASMSRWE
jgi:hypothetical protein